MENKRERERERERKRFSHFKSDFERWEFTSKTSSEYIT